MEGKHHEDLEVKVRGVVMDRYGRVLLSRLAKYGFWCLPGGTVETPEKLTEALRREFVEELDVSPDVGPVVSSQEFFRDNGKQVLDFWFWVENPESFENLDPSRASHAHENDRVEFVDLETFEEVFAPSNLREMVREWKEGGPRFIAGAGLAEAVRGTVTTRPGPVRDSVK